MHEAVYIVKLQLADEKQVSDDAGWNVKRTRSAGKNICFLILQFCRLILEEKESLSC